MSCISPAGRRWPLSVSALGCPWLYRSIGRSGHGVVEAPHDDSVLPVRSGAKGTRTPDPLLAKEVAATGGPAAARVKSTAGCSVNDRQSPWVTLLTGTWRARLGLADLPYSPAVYPRGQERFRVMSAL